MLLVQIPEHMHPSFIMIWFSQNQILILTVPHLRTFFFGVATPDFSLCFNFLFLPLPIVSTLYCISVCAECVYVFVCTFVMRYCLKVSLGGRRGSPLLPNTLQNNFFILFSTQFLPCRLELLRIS